MRNRSDMIGMMAKREEARKAAAMNQLRRLHEAHEQTQAMTDRLRTILADRRVDGPVSAAELRTAAMLNTKLAAECANQSERLNHLHAQLEQQRNDFAQKSHRAQYLEDAAHRAKAEEAEEREARAQASMPVIRR